ncbi:MAG: hypothetical protein ACHRXM_20090 [Isosphaerales bacterium]
MGAPSVLLAYFSPETTLPLMSIVTTIVGGAMLFTQGSIRFVVRRFRGALRRPQRVAGASEPHSHSRRAMLAEETRE